MQSWIRDRIVDMAVMILISFVFYFVFIHDPLSSQAGNDSRPLPSSLLHANTIFLSILIEAVPFVLIGVLISGIIQIYVTEDHVRRWLPQKRWKAVFFGCVLGSLFPACECGIVPIVRRLIGKGVPVDVAVGFLLTGPLINPVVFFSTYVAFGGEVKVAAMRMLIGFAVALCVAYGVGMMIRRDFSVCLRQGIPVHGHGAGSTHPSRSVAGRRLEAMFRHAIDEFFDMSKYLIMGALFAALVQTYVSSATLVRFGEGMISSTLTMMGLAYLLSLCSEADAFIAASFRNLFPLPSLVGFLVFGPMIDLKNTMMLLGVFRSGFVLKLLFLIAAAVFLWVLILHGGFLGGI